MSNRSRESSKLVDDVIFAPMERQSLAEEAAEQLRRLILLGTLPPGDAVPERELADRLGISRTPIREAIRLLTMEGLLEISPTRRPRVANPTFEDIGKTMMVMAAIEPLAGEQACQHATDTELSRVVEFHEKMLEISDGGDPLEFFDLDMALHQAIVAAAHNSVLEDTHRQINSMLWRARFMSSRRLQRARTRTLAQHQDIVDGLLARNSDATAVALRGHLDTAMVNIYASQQEDKMAEARGNDGT